MKKIIFGLLLITAGVLLIGFNAGLIRMDYKPIIFSWPMLLIAIGIMNIFGKESFFTGVILIFIGSFFLIPHFYYFPFNFTQLFWPVLLILVGILVIAKIVFSRSFNHHNHHFISKESNLDSGYIYDKNVFSGNKIKVSPCEFKGGKIENVFGGTEIDLRQTTLAEGKNILEIKCVFGGVSLIVPPDWVIHIEISAVMGGFTDKRSITPNSGSSNRELFIKGENVFGGGEIKSF
ncbi:MAG: cell wall-active antibiotics response protein [Bacteroidetes bacterium]|nr:cell wall-active antibiotics response protein [Bacteroidota bacterium]